MYRCTLKDLWLSTVSRVTGTGGGPVLYLRSFFSTSIISLTYMLQIEIAFFCMLRLLVIIKTQHLKARSVFASGKFTSKQ